MWVGERRVIWRGVAESTVADGDAPNVREARLREASSELVKRFGRTHAQAVWDAGLAAIARIDDIVREHAIDAGVARL